MQTKGADGAVEGIGFVQFVPVDLPCLYQSVAQAIASQDCRQQQRPGSAAHRHRPGKNGIEQHRQQHQQYPPGSCPDQAERHPRKVCGNPLGSAQHHARRHEILIGIYTEEFRQVEDAQQKIQGERYPLPPFFPVEQAVQQARQAAEAQSEGQHSPETQRFQVLGNPQMQQQLTVHRHTR